MNDYLNDFARSLSQHWLRMCDVCDVIYLKVYLAEREANMYPNTPEPTSPALLHA